MPGEVALATPWSAPCDRGEAAVSLVRFWPVPVPVDLVPPPDEPGSSPGS